MAAGEDGGVERAALGLGLGCGGALATAPYYAAPYYAAPGYGYAPAPVAPTTWYWREPVCSYVPGSVATGGPVNNLNQHPSKKAMAR